MPFIPLLRVLLLLGVIQTSSAFSEVLILSSKSSVYAQTIAKKLKSQIKQPSRSVHTLDIISNNDIVVALGQDAFLEASTKTTVPVVGSFLSSTDLPPSAGLNEAPRYQVHSGPPPKKLAEFLKLNFPNTTIGYIYTDNEVLFKRDMHKILKDSKTSLKAIRYSGNTFSDIRNLNKMGIDVMLISNNRDIYQSEHIRFILEALFRKKVPVVSMSVSLVRAGATVSIAPSANAVTKATAMIVNDHIKGKLPTPSRSIFIEDLVIEINPAMSNYYNIEFGG